MGPLEIDWRALRWPALAAAAAAALLAIAGSLALAQWREHQRLLAAAEQERAQAESRLADAHAERLVYRRYGERFRAMRERGWVGSGDAPGWPEVFARLERDLPGVRLHYEAGDSRARSPDEGPLAGEALTRIVRPMQIRLAAVHEDAVVTALQRLARSAPGLMALQRCRLERMRPPGAIALDDERANVRARCHLRWHRVHLGRHEGEPS